MATETSKRDPNFVTTLMGVDMSTGLLPTKVYVDETTHRLLVNAVISGGSLSGTEYTEGDTDASFSGFILMGQGPADTATTLKINASGELVVAATATLAKETIPVAGAVDAVAVAIVDTSGNQIASFGGGVQYTEADTDATITGTAVMWEDSANTLRAVSLAKSLPVTITDGAGSIISSFGGGIQYTEGDTDASITGTAMLMEGAANTLLPVPGTTTDGLLVNLGANNDVTVTGSVAVTNAGTFAVQVDGNALTSLQLIDDTVAVFGTDTYTEAVTKGNVIGAVRRDANTTLVDTTNEVAPLQVNATGELKVAQIQPLPAGTNAIGKLAANSGVDIGDVDILTINGQAPAFGTGVRSASTLRVTIATDDSVPVTIAAVPSHAVTNAGTFAVQESGAALTALQLIDDPVVTLGTTTYTEATTKGMVISAVRRDADTTLVDTTNEHAPLIVDARGFLKVEAFSGETLPVSLTSTTITGSVAVTNAGTFVVQENGAALTSLQLIDDVVYIDDTSTHSTGSSKGILMMAAATPTDTAVNANDIGAVGMTNNRAMYVSVQDALPAGTNNIGDVDVLTLPALPAGTNNIGDVDVLTVNGVAPAFGSGVRGATVQRVTIATDDVVPASQSGTWTVQPGNTANTTPWLVTDTPATSGGLSKFHLVGAATDNATNIKASAGQVYSITAFNVSASPRYLKFHNNAGTPTAGAGVTDTYLIPGNTSGAGFVINIDKGIAFSTGIAISIVTGIADANTTAIGASEVVVNIYYK